MVIFYMSLQPIGYYFSKILEMKPKLDVVFFSIYNDTTNSHFSVHR